MKTKLKRGIALVLLLSMLAASLSLFTACAGVYGGSSEIFEREELLLNIESESAEYDYAAHYFDEWDMPRFNLVKLEVLERLYRDNFVDDVGDIHTRAKKSAEIFLNYYYDEIELDDVTAVTDALISSYVETYGDRYSVYRTKNEYLDYSSDMSGSFVGIGVTVSYNKTDEILTVLNVSAGGGAEAAGILAGDVIISVAGKLVSEVGYDAAVNSIRGESGTSVDIGIMRGEEQLSFTVTRSKIVEQSVTLDINDGIAYIKITGFKRNTFGQFKEAVDSAMSADVRGIVYDLCGNPGGYLDTVVDMLDYIAPKGTELVSFTNNHGAPEYARDEHTVLLPSVVICDRDTASAAELFTSALRDFGEMGYLPVKIVGERSFGKGIMQDTFRFSDGSSITMTVAYYNPPSGENYHGKGIEPNVSFDLDNIGDAWRVAAEAELKELIAG